MSGSTILKTPDVNFAFLSTTPQEKTKPKNLISFMEPKLIAHHDDLHLYCSPQILTSPHQIHQELWTNLNFYDHRHHFSQNGAF